MIKVSVMGACGRMGRSIFSTLFRDDDITLVGATEVEGHEFIGRDAGELVGTKLGFSVTDDLDSAAGDADIIVDFTSPGSTLSHAEYASRNSKGMVIGTTGFSSKEEEKLSQYTASFPCVISPNMSIGVNVLFEVSTRLASLLGNDFDVEIVETHHRKKVDAPSGTALKLGRSVAEGLGLDFEKAAKFERNGAIGPRNRDEIGIQTLRGGDVVGDHTVMFLGDGERMELTHKALSRDNFSKGVLRAVKWLPGKPPGIYSMKEVLGI